MGYSIDLPVSWLPLPPTWSPILAILLVPLLSLRALEIARFFLFNPLRHVLGPILHIFFPLWHRYLGLTGRHSGLMDIAHRLYGPVVRWTDQVITIADPDLVRDVVAIKDVAKAENYKALFDGEVLLTTLDRWVEEGGQEIFGWFG
ncbi:hypothetical protein BDK51DRAFT_45197 [Blyttiomyces helicus]|uniref:Cytochrome P450 n=1 Tax=Blyttiomyces helicus TaxID=388810 RepID=A0A4P9WCD6_9FUNG|nr:hypothetical protein BDK51DRAFT_45197 [Blyttiomyces helicus]|eukprot:RKO89305.1 hypothetical protein BDK51DRAFT_45197 [Blyttiomyces helicus]